MAKREMGKCDRYDMFCNCSRCPDHCAHVCAESEGQCCRTQEMMDAKCPFCGENARGCGCHTSTHGG